MDRDAVVALIKASIAEQVADAGEIDENTSLFGEDGLLDSMGLVNLTADVEQQVNDDLGLAIVIADDRAMSQKNSPFRTVGALADYVMQLIREGDAAAS